MADFKELKRIYSIQIPGLDKLIERVSKLNNALQLTESTLEKARNTPISNPENLAALEKYNQYLRESESKVKKIANEQKLATREVEVLTTATKALQDAEKNLNREKAVGEKARLDALRADKLAIEAKFKQAQLEKTLVQAEAARIKSLIAQEKELDRLIDREEKKAQVQAKANSEQNAAVGSINQMRAALVLLQKQYDALAATDRNSNIGQGLKKDIATLRDELLKLEGETGRFQRNVGNYKSAFNGLGNSVNQITREFSSFTYSVQTGFLALSNNLPIFFDEIARTRAEVAALRAQGVATQGVFTRLARVLISWQTALSVGVTLLTVYGKEIGEFFSALFKGTEALDRFTESQRILNQAIGDSNGEYAKAVAQVNELRINIDLAKKGFLGKTEVVNQYNESIGKATGEVKDLKQAEVELIKNADAYVQMMLYKAAANATLQEAAQKAVDAEKKRREDEARIAKIDTTDDDGIGEFIKRGEQNLAKANQKAAKSSQEVLLDIAKSFQENAAKIAKENKFDFFTKTETESGNKLRAITHKFFSEELADHADQNRKLSEIEMLGFQTRATARRNAFKLQREIIQGERDVELRNELDKLNAVRQQKDVTKQELLNAANDYRQAEKEINQKANFELKKNEQSLQDDLLEIKLSSTARERELDQKANADTLVGLKKMDEQKIRIVKDSFDKAVSEISTDESNKLVALAIELEKKISDILKSNKTPKQKQEDLTNLKRDSRVSAIEIEITAQEKLVAAYKEARKANIVTEKEYNAEMKKLADMRIEESERDIKKFIDLEEYKEEALQAIRDGVEETLQQLMQTVFESQRRRLEKEHEASRERLDIEKEQVLSQAQSAEEKESIDRQYETKKREMEKVAFEKQKQQRIKEIKIETALGVAKAIAQNPPPSPIGILSAFFVEVQAAIQLASVKAQQFNRGGKVLPQLAAGKINAAPNVPTMPGGDNILAYVKAGEVILNKRQQAMLGGDETFRRMQVPGFYALGGKVPGDYLQPPVNPQSFLKGSGFNSGADLQEIGRMIASSNEAINKRIDRITVHLDPRAALNAQGKIVKTDSIGSI